MPTAISLLVTIFLLTIAGNWACKWMFMLTGLTAGSSKQQKTEVGAGRVIGALERVAIAVGVVLQSWEILAAVVALKSVARFKELDDQKFAEYFLVGSLFSILWSVIVTTTWMAYDHHWGSDVRAQITHMIQDQEPIKNTDAEPGIPTN